jgi:hypothetical protein
MDGTSEKPKERYSESYLAMNAAQTQPAPVRTVKGRSRGKWRVALLVILIGCGVAYLQRALLLRWLEQNRQTAPIVEKIRESFGISAEQDGMLGGSAPDGDQRTFSSGQGFGVVTPDDGSDTFRVVAPPESGAAP